MKRFTLPKDGGLIEAGLPNGIKHTFERIPAHIHEDEEAASKVIARKIADEINASEGVFRLGLSTGSSPVFLTQEIVVIIRRTDILSSPKMFFIVIHSLGLRRYYFSFKYAVL